MANKIIQLTNVNPLPKSNETLEKWVDIDMDAVNNWNHKTVEAPKLSDFVKILRTENLSKDDEDSLKAICAEKAIEGKEGLRYIVEETNGCVNSYGELIPTVVAESDQQIK